MTVVLLDFRYCQGNGHKCVRVYLQWKVCKLSIRKPSKSSQQPLSRVERCLSETGLCAPVEHGGKRMNMTLEIEEETWKGVSKNVAFRAFKQTTALFILYSLSEIISGLLPVHQWTESPKCEFQ